MPFSISVTSFGASVADKKDIYILFVRSVLEQSCPVWHSGLTSENAADLERVQKSACKIILQDKYIDYKNALSILEIDNLVDRRQELCLKFAEKCLKNEKISDNFQKKKHIYIKWTLEKLTKSE